MDILKYLLNKVIQRGVEVVTVLEAVIIRVRVIIKLEHNKY